MAKPRYSDVAGEEYYVSDQDVVDLWEKGFSVGEIQAELHKSTWLIYRILRQQQACNLLKRPIRPYEPVK